MSHRDGVRCGQSSVDVDGLLAICETVQRKGRGGRPMTWADGDVALVDEYAIIW